MSFIGGVGYAELVFIVHKSLQPLDPRPIVTGIAHEVFQALHELGAKIERVYTRVAVARLIEDLRLQLRIVSEFAFQIDGCTSA